MKSIRILVTAGPTREPIDPVRFISNYSTGAMGYAIAKVASRKGHKVTLITGPTYLKPPRAVKVIDVETAQQMLEEVKDHLRANDSIVMAAAVSDFRTATPCNKKLKRNSLPQTLALHKNPDILYWVSRQKKGKILVGFCMETEHLIRNATRKMLDKKLDIIVANKIDSKRTAFGPNKTRVVIIAPGGQKLRLTGTTKARIAEVLLDKIEELAREKVRS